jgi:hypothetical protein
VVARTPEGFALAHGIVGLQVVQLDDEIVG